MVEEVGQALLIIVLKVKGRHQKALDDLPCMFAIVGFCAARFQRIKRNLNRVLHW